MSYGTQGLGRARGRRSAVGYPAQYSIGNAGASGAITDPDAFILTVETTGASETMEIQGSGTGHLYDINWGDGTVETSQTAASPSHVYASAGTHTITITGTYKRIYVNNNATYKTKYRTVEQWGDVGMTNMNAAFYGCSGLTSIATDPPNVTNFSNCFTFCTSLASLPTGLFDNNTAVTNFIACFVGCTSLTSLPTGLFDNNTAVTYFSFCFTGCTSLTTAGFGTWAWGAVTDATGMFSNVTLTTADYNAGLDGIYQQSTTGGGSGVQSSVAFHAGNSVDTTGPPDGIAASLSLTVNDAWTILDGTADYFVFDGADVIVNSGDYVVNT